MDSGLGNLCKVMVLLWMAALAREDARCGSIPAWLCGLGIAGGAAYRLWSVRDLLGLVAWREVPLLAAAGLMPGVLLLMLAFISRQQVGSGDGWTVLGLGLWLSPAALALLVAGAGAAGAVAAAVLLVLRKARFQRKIPFIPFLLGGYLLVLALDHMG